MASSVLPWTPELDGAGSMLEEIGVDMLHDIMLLLDRVDLLRLGAASRTLSHLVHQLRSTVTAIKIPCGAPLKRNLTGLARLPSDERVPPRPLPLLTTDLMSLAPPLWLPDAALIPQWWLPQHAAQPTAWCVCARRVRLQRHQGGDAGLPHGNDRGRVAPPRRRCVLQAAPPSAGGGGGGEPCEPCPLTVARKFCHLNSLNMILR